MRPDSRSKGRSKLPGSQTEEPGCTKSLGGWQAAEDTRNVKTSSEDGARLLGHEHLEAFLDGDSVSRVFVVWGESSRVGRARLLSQRIKLLQRVDPLSLLVEVILEKHDHTKAERSNSVRSCL